MNLTGLHSEVVRTVSNFSEKLKDIHKENLRSVVIYGSAIGEDFIVGKSNINIIVVLKNIEFSDLKKSLKVVNEGRKKGIVVPLFFTEEYIRSSTDVFPIEFLEIKQNYRVVYGEDLFRQLPVNPKNTRLQCEQQIKGGLIRLRQVYLEIGMKEKEIRNLLISSFTSLIPIFKYILKLNDSNFETNKREIIIEKLNKEFNVSKEVFLTVWKLKKGEKVQQDIETLFSQYTSELRKLSLIIDRMKI